LADCPIIPVFSDLDLAQRFVERLGDGADYKPISTPTPEEFAIVLYRLAQLGETHVVFDPEPTDVYTPLPRARMFPIHRVIDGIANRHR
jgi:hypothetical protein